MKLRKEVIYILIIIAITILLVCMCKNNNNSFSIDYKIDDYKIRESFDEDKSLYYYTISSKDNNYETIYSSQEITKKNIKEVKKYSKDEYTCIVPIGNNIEEKPLCSKDSEQIDYRLVSNELKDEIIEYYEGFVENVTSIENYELYTNERIIMWDYDGINIIENQNIDKVKIYNKDIYNANIATIINDTFVMADYNQEHE